MPRPTTTVAAVVKAYRGLLTRVAGRLHLSRSYVSKVASGERRSARVEKALGDEMARIDKRQDKVRAKSAGA